MDYRDEFEDIELVDRDYGTVKKAPHIRKIKFKAPSFKAITGVWKWFRMHKLYKKLEKAQKKLLKTKAKPNAFIPKKTGKPSPVEKKLMERSMAVAELEATVDYLVDGEYRDVEFINSRAIKLKDNMMRNMNFNRKYIYSVPKNKYTEIFKEDETDTIVEEEAKQMAKEVSGMMHEPTQELGTPNREEIKEAVDEMFKAQEQNATKEGEELQQKDLESAIAEELAKVKVSQNGSSAAKINKFINDDGTYHLKREDMDADFRITRIDGGEYVPTPTVPTVQYSGEGEITPISSEIGKTNFEQTVSPTKVAEPVETEVTENKETPVDLNADIFGTSTVATEPKVETTEETEERFMPIVVPEKFEVAEMTEDKFKFATPEEVEVKETPVEEVAPVVEETEEKDTSVVEVPVEETPTEEVTETEEVKTEQEIPAEDENIHFDFNAASVEDLTKAVEQATTRGDLEALINRVQVLKAEQARTKAQVAAAEEQAKETEKQYQETINRFIAYGNALEEDCNHNLKAAEARQESQREVQEKINAMLNEMGPVAEKINVQETGKSK